MSWDTQFNAWLDMVDAALVRLVGIGWEDLPDQSWADWFDAGMSPSEAAREALESEGLSC
jgi:hypothetical protein